MFRNFTANRAALLKNRETGNPMPIYLINLLPKDNFDEIYKITEICNLSITLERFKGSNIVKQCHRCQEFGQAFEICNFLLKCVKCAGSHLSPDCLQICKIIPTYASCSGLHPATYKDCPNPPPPSKLPLKTNLPNQTVRKTTPKTKLK